MNEELNVYDVVRYFVEKSGMLFFYTKEDIKVAYDRISTIFNVEKKYYNLDVTDKLVELKKYYDFFIKNFDEYSQIEENKELFIDIMRYDSSIMFCGNSDSLRKYVLNEEKKLKKLNRDLSFFQRKKNVRSGMTDLRKIIEKIQDYKIFYGFDVPVNKIDEALKFLKLDSFANENDIYNAYNTLLNDEYNNIMNSSFSMQLLMSKNKQLNYFKDIISGAYPNINLGLSLLDKYAMSDIAINRAFNYFKLSPSCNENEMMDAVSSVIDEIMTMGSPGYRSNVILAKKDIFVTNNIRDLNGNGNNNVDVELLLEIANFYKNILYNKFGVRERVVVTPVIKKKNISSTVKNDSGNLSFDALFQGLGYDDAEKLYYTLMSRLHNSDDVRKKENISNLEMYWNIIKDDLYEKENTHSNNVPKR